MADFHVLAGAGGQVSFPAVRTIGVTDLLAALRLGWRDFWQKPSHLAFLGLIYPLAGAAIGLWTSGSNSWPLLYPLISGFALVGPLAALPIYEMSRRQELGLDTTWRSAFGVLRSPAMPSIIAVGILLLAIFTVWLMLAQYLYESLFGPGSPATLMEFVNQVINTAPGQSLMIWGNLIGLGFAAITLACSVISIPLLLDRDGGAAVAVQTSIRVTMRNPFVIAVWGLIVAALLIIGSLPFLVGLAIVVPVLGHATWHLYRRVVEPAPGRPR
ncbi:MAG TPA: DUF2189 domain-containing protein [Alphaproteobacteria bacterium]|nr:DUF2189 domain-containing protein [Alphaproteobacteria bacterium]